MKVLFVDDDTRVLEAIERVLFEIDSAWGVCFVNSGEQALTEIQRVAYDVVVSDLRMPGMDGVEMLGRVQELSPRTVRIVLSGHSDEEAALKSVHCAHQYLAKPCAAETLHEILQRLHTLSQLLPDRRLQTLVGGLSSLPSDTEVQLELMRLAEREETTADELAQLVRGDPAWTSKLLQITCSAFFNSASSVTDVDTAIMRLGLRTLRMLARGLDTSPPRPSALPILTTVKQLRLRAGRVANMAAHMARLPEDAAIAHVVGMLCDVGQLVLLGTAPERQYLADSEAAQRGVARHTAEHDLWGTTHAAVGAYLLGLWGLPIQIVNAVANHHAPERVAGDRLGPAQLVWLASCIVDAEEPTFEQLSAAGAEQLYASERRRFEEGAYD